MDELNKQKPEVPIIIIERDEQPQPQEVVTKAVAPSRKQKWLKRFLALVAIGCLMVAILAGYYFWNYYYNIGVSVSVTPEQNIEKLQKPAKQETPEVVIVYLYCRSVDHKADSTYIGTLVVNGEERQSDTHRLGYMAMLGGNSVIGISRSEKVNDYVQEHGGSFFRQFILVSNGDIPGRFFLHGKVERRAIGRIDDQLYFIATRHKETLWDFADALREYGFIDAIYITGGADYVFYRDKDGFRHDIGDKSDYPHTKWKGIIPWLVFRN